MVDEVIKIFDRDLDAGGPPLIVAELSANHRQDLGLALESVRVAADCGADAVKFQHFTPDGLTVMGDHSDLRVGEGNLWTDRTLHDLYSEAMMPWDWTESLAEEARRSGIGWFSTPFDTRAVDFLVKSGVEALKIASFELVDLPLIRHCARTGLPIVMSTGMASLEEVEAAVSAVRAAGNDRIILLRCNSTYPAEADQMDLSTIGDMRRRWKIPVGLSDHTTTSTSAIVATSLGACLIEKHFTLDRSLGGPDAAFSLEPDQLRNLVLAVHEAYRALGTLRYGPSPSEASSLQFRRSLRVLRDVEVGEVVSTENVGSRRPAGGMPPEEFVNIEGLRFANILRRGDPVCESDLEQSSS